MRIAPLILAAGFLIACTPDPQTPVATVAVTANTTPTEREEGLLQCMRAFSRVAEALTELREHNRHVTLAVESLDLYPNEGFEFPHETYQQLRAQADLVSAEGDKLEADCPTSHYRGAPIGAQLQREDVGYWLSQLVSAEMGVASDNYYACIEHGLTETNEC